LWVFLDDTAITLALFFYCSTQQYGKTSDMGMPKMNDMIPPVHKDMLDTASPTTIEVINLTIDTSKNSPSPVGIEVIDLTIDTSKKTSDEPSKKKVKTTTINIMVMVTMPGAVHPVMKKCSVCSTKNLIEIQNMSKYPMLFASKCLSIMSSCVCTVLYLYVVHLFSLKLLYCDILLRFYLGVDCFHALLHFAFIVLTRHWYGCYHG
jgi:hypothetical protein